MKFSQQTLLEFCKCYYFMFGKKQIAMKGFFGMSLYTNLILEKVIIVIKLHRIQHVNSGLDRVNSDDFDVNNKPHGHPKKFDNTHLKL